MTFAKQMWGYMAPRVITGATSALITYGVSTADAEAIATGLAALVAVILEFIKTRR